MIIITILIPPFGGMAVYTFVTNLFIAILVLLILIGLPWLIKKRRINWDDLGLSKSLTKIGILIVPIGIVVTYIFTAGLMILASYVIPGFDADQEQFNFGKITQLYDYIFIFISLIIIAPVFEELVFRGYLYGKLKKYAPIWLAILITSVTFGVFHMAWNVGIATFVGSIIMCLAREYTGSIKSSILIHATNNGIVYFLTFILPLITTTIK